MKNSYTQIRAMSTKEKTSELLLEEKVSTQNEIVLYNDDVNTFNHVIDTLVEFCDHSTIQAEQCAHLVHYKGKCAVKVGSYNELKPIYSALVDKGLSAELN